MDFLGLQVLFLFHEVQEFLFLFHELTVSQHGLSLQPITSRVKSTE
jgi:hypothetical protein